MTVSATILPSLEPEKTELNRWKEKLFLVGAAGGRRSTIAQRSSQPFKRRFRSRDHADPRYGEGDPVQIISKFDLAEKKIFQRIYFFTIFFKLSFSLRNQILVLKATLSMHHNSKSGKMQSAVVPQRIFSLSLSFLFFLPFFCRVNPIFFRHFPRGGIVISKPRPLSNLCHCRNVNFSVQESQKRFEIQQEIGEHCPSQKKNPYLISPFLLV